MPVKPFERSFILVVSGICSFFVWKWHRFEEKHHRLERGQIMSFFSISTFCLKVFINNSTQNCHTYLISVSKLKSFEFSSKWRQKRIFYSMCLVSMLQQTKNMQFLQWILKFLTTCHHPNAISKRIKLGQPATSHFKDHSQSFKMVTDFI